MAEKIYIRNASGELEPLTEERFETEDLLQELIGQHPELLAGDQMRPDDPLRWILIRREMPGAAHCTAPRSVALSSGRRP